MMTCFLRQSRRWSVEAQMLRRFQFWCVSFRSFSSLWHHHRPKMCLSLAAQDTEYFLHPSSQQLHTFPPFPSLTRQRFPLILALLICGYSAMMTMKIIFVLNYHRRSILSVTTIDAPDSLVLCRCNRAWTFSLHRRSPRDSDPIWCAIRPCMLTSRLSCHLKYMRMKFLELFTKFQEKIIKHRISHISCKCQSCAYLCREYSLISSVCHPLAAIIHSCWILKS